MRTNLDPLSDKVITLWENKAFRDYVRKNDEFVQSLLDFATAPNRGTLIDLYFELHDFVTLACTIKNGRIKPAAIDDLTRHVRYEMMMLGYAFTTAAPKPTFAV